MTVDMLGMAVVMIRDDAGVAAITPRVRGAERAPNDAAPLVIVRKLGADYAPFGARRARLQRQLFAAVCVGSTFIQAGQLAGAVVDAVNLKGPRRDASGRYLAISLVEGGGDATNDPQTGDATETVTFTFTGGAQAPA